MRLVTLGDLRLTDSDGRTVAYPEKALITICYLLNAKGNERTRSDIAQFLWEGGEPARASANLRALLLRVKNHQAELGVELLIIRETTVALKPGVLESDLGALEVQGQDPAARLSAFLNHCQGQFLAGAEDFSERGRDWITAQRESIVARFSHALDTMIAADMAAQHDLIRDSAYRLLQVDPQCEAAYRALMKVYAAAGQPNSARATFDRLKDRLKDLEVSPDRSTMDLLRQIAKVEPRIKAAPAIASGQDRRDHSTQLPRLALLPPANAAADSLLPGLLEDVTLGLCAFKTISVVAPHTSARMAGDADRLGAYERHRISYVLDTTISTRPGPETLFAQLLDVRNDTVIWADHFDASVATLQQQYRVIARRIAASVAGSLEAHEVQRLGFEQNPNAYQYYLMGQRFLKRIDLPDIRRARKAFRLSVKEDPKFPAVLAGLARTDHMEWLLTARGDSGLLKSAESFALHAIETNSEGSGGYRELGVAKLFQHQFDESIEAFEKAEAASPCHADLIADYADTLIHSSDPVQGLAKIEWALELNPLAPDVYHWTAAGANYCLERYEAALACLSRMEDQSPISRVAAACWGMLGDRKKAHAYKRKTMATHPDFDVETWLSIMPVREQWQKEQYREGLRKAGFS